MTNKPDLTTTEGVLDWVARWQGNPLACYQRSVQETAAKIARAMRLAAVWDDPSINTLWVAMEEADTEECKR